MLSYRRMAAAAMAITMTVIQLSACAPASGEKTKTNASDSGSGPLYSRDFSEDGVKQLKVVQGEGTVSVAEGNMEITSQQEDDTIIIDENAPEFHNGEVEFVFDPKNDNQGGMYGIILRYTEDGEWTFIGQDGHSAKDPDLTSWVMCTSDGKKELLCTDGQRVYARRQKPYTLKVRLIDDALTLYLDQVMIYSGEVGVTQGRGKAGLRYVNGSGATVSSFQVTELSALPQTLDLGKGVSFISSSELKVTMDSSFPRVVEYELLPDNKVLYGQEIPYDVIEINNTRYVPRVSGEFTDNSAVYHMNVEELNVKFDVNYRVEQNVLRMEISNIMDDGSLVKTINFPNQSMVSMRNTQPGAELRVNDYRKETVLDLTKTWASRAYQTTSLAVLSSDDVAAAINNGNINNRREIAYQTVKNGDHYTTGLWTNEFQYRGLDLEPLDTLWSEVAITGDRNGDGKVDYQDGAIARRDDIGTERLGSENSQNSMSMIAMDVGSIAQYPFLRILDNIKKFHAGTDGFGQMILIKGYQSEGHDSSHPDYANISSRAGGADDFKVLLEEAGKYNAGIGLHINHTEAYPEAKQYSKDLVADTPGWSWYDDSYHLIRENDILDKENGLEKRLDDLASLTNGKLSMIYVDTYQDSRWQCDKIAKKITDLGWMLGTEYSEEMIKYSTWSHTINSKNFDYGTQGNLVRFIDNQNKDIFANDPLFRGLVNRNKNAGFLGWQTSWSYDSTMENFYTQVLPQNYLANFPVSQWQDKDKVLLGKNNEVMTTLVDGVNQISKDGNLIADGNKIFIPWSPADEEKIYHWNSDGGETTWDLPASWNDQKEVKLFTLSDEGKTDEKVLSVTNHAITIHANPKTAYVIYKGTEDAETTDLTTYEWGKGSPVKDMGFDSHTFGYAWEKASSTGSTDHITFADNAYSTAAEKDAKDNQTGNTHIHVQGAGDAVLSQTMEGLKPGQTYSASVFAEAEEGRTVTISVTTPDGKTVSNGTDDYSAAYGCPHNDRYGTAYQRIKLNFIQPEGETTATISLTAQNGSDSDSWANFDNVRVTPVGSSDTKGHTYYEDFENVDQEFGIFICPTRVEQVHLSERNGDWTKDVIDGRYSLKIRGGGAEDGPHNYMRTVSHRMRLLPNTTYSIGMEYIVTDVDANQEVLEGKNAFVLGVKSAKAEAAGDTEHAVVLQQPCGASESSPQKLSEITFTTGNYDDYYVDFLDDTYNHEFVIDNFYVDQN